jgi:hypothetical protein
MQYLFHDRKREMRVESHALLRQRHIMKLESTVDASEGLRRLRALQAALYVPAVLWFSKRYKTRGMRLSIPTLVLPRERFEELTCLDFIDFSARQRRRMLDK